jgi:hypothetical protein
MSGRNSKVIRKLVYLINQPKNLPGEMTSANPSTVAKRKAYNAWSKAINPSIPHSQRLRPTLGYAKYLFGKLGI